MMMKGYNKNAIASERPLTAPEYPDTSEAHGLPTLLMGG